MSSGTQKPKNRLATLASQSAIALWGVLAIGMITAMFSPPYLLLVSVGLLAVCFYYAAVLAGRIKEPMMAHFRRYGEENRVYPMPRLIIVTGYLLITVASLVPIQLLGWTLMIAGFLCVIGYVIISRLPHLRELLPRWYYHMLQDMSREDRRAIAYAWLRLPFRTRLRLNGDAYAFQTFLDEVRMTVIYGARDPDDPWVVWN